MIRRAVWVTALWCASAASALAQSRPMFVDDTAPPGGDGSSWAAAYTDLYDALDAARERGGAQQVWIAAGRYATDRDGHGGPQPFVVPGGVTILGGFPDGGGPLLARDANAHPTILTGDRLADDTDDPATWADNARQTVVAGSIAQPVIDGVTIERGRTNVLLQGDLTLRRVTVRDSRGGPGVRGSADLLRLEACRFLDNANDFEGGAISVSAGVYASDCLFEGNEAVGWGGAVHLAQGAARSRFERCVFRANRVTSASADAEGGAIHSGSGRGALVDCRFEENTAEAGSTGVARGGAVAGFAGIIEGCAFERNRADDGGAIYGASYLQGSEFRENIAEGDGGAVASVAYAVDDCDFMANRAGGAGGAIAGANNIHATRFTGNEAAQGGALSGAGMIRSSEFTRNRAAGDGGAIFGADAPIESTVFLANEAGGVGGAIADFSGDLRHATVAQNDAAVHAGVQATSLSARVLDSILWGNRDAAGAGDDLESMQIGGEPIVMRSIVEGLSRFEGFDNLADDPRFRDPVGFDGEARTGDEDVSLAAGSPAIDGALPVGPGFPAGRSDARGFPRAVTLGDAAIAGVSDRGAIEAQDADADGVIDLDAARARAINDCNRDGLADGASAGSLRFVRTSRIAPARSLGNGRFGESLAAVSGGLAAMSFTENPSGSIEIVRETADGWRFDQRIEPRTDDWRDSWHRARFSASGGWIAVVATGGVDLLQRAGGAWGHAQRLDVTLPTSPVGVAIRGDALAVTTTAGVEVYRRIAGVWTHEQTIDVPYAGGGVALAGDMLVASAYQGAERVVAIFEWNDAVWTRAATLRSPLMGGFVTSVQDATGSLIVGADASGWPLVFRRVGGVWSAGELLMGRPDATYTSRVAIRKGRVLVADVEPSELVEWRREGDAWVVASRTLAPVSFSSMYAGPIAAGSTFVAVAEPTESNFNTGAGAILLYEPRVRDANGDRRPDECPACPPDFTRDGIVDGSDLGALLRGWGGRDADLDLSADGVVNAADLGLLIQAWGFCP